MADGRGTGLSRGMDLRLESQYRESRHCTSVSTVRYSGGEHSPHDPQLLDGRGGDIVSITMLRPCVLRNRSLSFLCSFGSHRSVPASEFTQRYPFSSIPATQTPTAQSQSTNSPPSPRKYSDSTSPHNTSAHPPHPTWSATCPPQLDKQQSK